MRSLASATPSIRRSARSAPNIRNALSDLLAQSGGRRRVISLIKRRFPSAAHMGIFGVKGQVQGFMAEHLSVYQTSPKLWEREAFEEKLDGAPEATGEPGKFSAGELGRLTVRVFFSAGAGLLAWSHMPVETAQ